MYDSLLAGHFQNCQGFDTLIVLLYPDMLPLSFHLACLQICSCLFADLNYIGDFVGPLVHNYAQVLMS